MLACQQTLQEWRLHNCEMVLVMYGQTGVECTGMEWQATCLRD